MAKAAFPSDNQDKFMLRLPEGMRERIKAAAEKNGRSMNSEIVSLLEEKFPEPVQMQPEQLVDALLRVLSLSGREQSLLLQELSTQLAKEYPGQDESAEARGFRVAVFQDLLSRHSRLDDKK